ncbi:zinc finger 593 [Olea europaea subsp. europaea]|uniref:Zinc finger 593 n=1 Tax=Olea europaea subsp. europaea TaxID=158383 RepID=A0A8S0URB2_OLEEU|nr:zinc finger 593 [Olea europaea subsp. europaea]
MVRWMLWCTDLHGGSEMNGVALVVAWCCTYLRGGGAMDDVVHCRYFPNVAVRDEHFKTKKHRRRVKQMMGPAPHTQLDAELAAGMGMPDNGPKLMAM